MKTLIFIVLLGVLTHTYRNFKSTGNIDIFLLNILFGLSFIALIWFSRHFMGKNTQDSDSTSSDSWFDSDSGDGGGDGGD